jgi:predicted nucleic acid-binding protein
MADAGKIVFDTNWVINFIKNKVNAQQFDGADRHISVITRIELYGFPGISPQEREDTTRFLKGVMVVPLTDEVEQTAIEVRRRYRHGPWRNAGVRGRSPD